MAGPHPPEAESRNGSARESRLCGKALGREGTLDLLDAARGLPQVDFILMERSRKRSAGTQAAPATSRYRTPPRDKVLEWFLDSDLLVSPAIEGSPNAVLEAMAASLPVVATRVVGCP